MARAIRHEKNLMAIVPDVVDVTLYYVNENKWMLQEPEPTPIRFRALGKTMGSFRWRPHLIQHKDPLPPIQGKKEYTEMLNALRESSSNNIELECSVITQDLLDDISGEDD